MPSVSALILGLVQGLTEFLPISSSGHLVLVSWILDYRSPGLVLDAIVHLATTLAVIIYFRTRIVSLIKGAVNDPESRHVILMLALAFAATSVVGLALSPWISAIFESPAVAAGMLLVTAAALVSIRYVKPAASPAPLLEISWKVALIVGLAQGVAIFPGISRSGLTIVAGVWGGQSRTSAAEFSFLLAVPTLLAATLFSLVREPELSVTLTGDFLAAGVVAFVAGLAAIYWLMRWLQRGRLWWFSAYCGLVGIGSLLVWGLGIL